MLFEHAATARLKRIADRAVTANHFGGMIAELVPNSKTAAISDELKIGRAHV